MSKIGEIAQQMIFEKVSEVIELNEEINDLLGDGEDDYYMEKIAWKATRVGNITLEIRTLERLLERAGNETD